MRLLVNNILKKVEGFSSCTVKILFAGAFLFAFAVIAGITFLLLPETIIDGLIADSYAEAFLTTAQKTFITTVLCAFISDYITRK